MPCLAGLAAGLMAAAVVGSLWVRPLAAEHSAQVRRLEAMERRIAEHSAQVNHRVHLLEEKVAEQAVQIKSHQRQLWEHLTTPAVNSSGHALAPDRALGFFSSIPGLNWQSILSYFPNFMQSLVNGVSQFFQDINDPIAFILKMKKGLNNLGKHVVCFAMGHFKDYVSAPRKLHEEDSPAVAARKAHEPAGARRLQSLSSGPAVASLYEYPFEFQFNPLAALPIPFDLGDTNVGVKVAVSMKVFAQVRQVQKIGRVDIPSAFEASMYFQVMGYDIIRVRMGVSSESLESGRPPQPYMKFTTELSPLEEFPMNLYIDNITGDLVIGDDARDVLNEVLSAIANPSVCEGGRRLEDQPAIGRRLVDEEMGFQFSAELKCMKLKLGIGFKLFIVQLEKEMELLDLNELLGQAIESFAGVGKEQLKLFQGVLKDAFDQLTGCGQSQDEVPGGSVHQLQINAIARPPAKDQFTRHVDVDAFIHFNVDELVGSKAAAKEKCLAMAYCGGFAYWKGTAFFRDHTADELRKSFTPKEGVTFYLRKEHLPFASLPVYKASNADV